MKFTSLFVAVLLLLSGCSSNPIQPSYYLLRPAGTMDSATLEPSRDFALGNVILSSYIDQQGLVLQTEAGEMRPARHHLWAEPMYDGMRTFLLQAISAAKGKDLFPARFSKEATVVDIRIDQLHGSYDGQAQLVAYWWLRRQDEILASYRFAESRTQGQDGYAALADTEKALLNELAGKIAATLVAVD